MSEQYPALRYNNKMWEDCKNGVLTIICDSWKEFESRVREYSKYEYIWRGQSRVKPLLPTIYRGRNTPDDEKIQQHLKKFKKDMPGADVLQAFLDQAQKLRTEQWERALSEFYEMIHPQKDDKDPKENYVEEFMNTIYWAIGQHHGLKTPLLDWSKDPYKALFFALCRKEEKDGKRVVLGLAEKSRRLLDNVKNRYIRFLHNLGFVKTILDDSDIPTGIKERISQMFDRISMQEGLFTQTLYNDDIEEYAKKCYTIFKNKREEEIVFLIKIIIDDGIREDFLEALEGEKITFKAMCPDLQGAALDCNLKLEKMLNQGK